MAGLALDDTACEEASTVESVVGAVSNFEPLQSPAAHTRVEVAGSRQVSRMQLEMDDWIGSEVVHVFLVETRVRQRINRSTD